MSSYQFLTVSNKAYVLVPVLAQDAREVVNKFNKKKVRLSAH